MTWSPATLDPEKVGLYQAFRFEGDEQYTFDQIESDPEQGDQFRIKLFNTIIHLDLVRANGCYYLNIIRWRLREAIKQTRIAAEKLNNIDPAVADRLETISEELEEIADEIEG